LTTGIASILSAVQKVVQNLAKEVVKIVLVSYKLEPNKIYAFADDILLEMKKEGQIRVIITRGRVSSPFDSGLRSEFGTEMDLGTRLPFSLVLKREASWFLMGALILAVGISTWNPAILFGGFAIPTLAVADHYLK
jgi:hypothetical protein